MTTKFGHKDPWPECNALLGWKGIHPWSTSGQTAQGWPMATKFGKMNVCPDCNTLLGSKVTQGSSRVLSGQIVGNALWPPNLGRMQDQSVTHYWVRNHRCHSGQPEVTECSFCQRALWCSRCSSIQGMHYYVIDVISQAYRLGCPTQRLFR